MAVSRKGAVAPIVIGVLGVVILLFLGSWQVQRLAWKEQLISELEARMQAAPVEIPASVDAERDRYLRVKFEGVVHPEELPVLTSIKVYGPGFRTIAPVKLADGRRFLLDLGFVPERYKDLASRTDSPRQSGAPVPIEATGVLYWPNETDSFTPAPDEKARIWFARDLALMSDALATEPYMIVAEAHSLGKLPLPRPPGVDLPNRHLEYALTWFGLAIVWAGMSIVWLRSELRKHARKTGAA